MAFQNIFDRIGRTTIAVLVGMLFLAPGSFAQAETNQDTLAVELQQQITALLLEQAIETKPVVTVSPHTQSCRNTQILSYSPLSGTTQGSLSEFVFYTKENTRITSLELSINKKAYPVQYTRLADGSYKARVVNLEDLQGNLYISMGAQSEDAQACNDLLHTSFIVTSENNAQVVAHSNTKTPSTPVATNNNSTSVSNTIVATKKDPVAAQDTATITSAENKQTNSIASGIVATTPNATTTQPWSLFSWFTRDNKDQTLTSENITATSTTVRLAVSTTTATTTALARASSTQTEEHNTKEKQLALGIDDLALGAGQTALLFGLIDPTAEKCSTVGSTWSWFVWLGIIWLWLIAVWVAISFYAEPVFGTASYSRRLLWTMITAGVLGILLWFVTNPCLTHAWLPATFIGMSVLLHWLYSEDTHTV